MAAAETTIEEAISMNPFEKRLIGFFKDHTKADHAGTEFVLLAVYAHVRHSSPVDRSSFSFGN